MAGTMTFAYDNGAGRTGYANVKQVVVAWTSDASGNASGTTDKIVGWLIKGVTVPAAGGSAPTNLYDLAVTDANGVDVLGNCRPGGCGAPTACGSGPGCT